jgi:hypothetical protein
VCGRAGSGEGGSNAAQEVDRLQETFRASSLGAFSRRWGAFGSGRTAVMETYQRRLHDRQRTGYCKVRRRRASEKKWKCARRTLLDPHSWQ